MAENNPIREQLLYPGVHSASICCLYRPGNSYYQETPEPWGDIPFSLKPANSIRIQYSFTPILSHSNSVAYTIGDEFSEYSSSDDDFTLIYKNECCRIRWGFDIGSEEGTSINVCTDRIQLPNTFAPLSNIQEKETALSNSIIYLNSYIDIMATVMVSLGKGNEEQKALLAEWEADDRLSKINGYLESLGNLSTDNMVAWDIVATNLKALLDSTANELAEIINNPYSSSVDSMLSLSNAIYYSLTSTESIRISSDSSIKGFWTSFFNNNYVARKPAEEEGDMGDATTCAPAWGFRQPIENVFPDYPLKDEEEDDYSEYSENCNAVRVLSAFDCNLDIEALKNGASIADAMKLSSDCSETCEPGKFVIQLIKRKKTVEE